MNRGIHSRGYLPHWDFAKSVQAITFRFADSVPSKVIKAWKQELATIPDDKQRSKQLHRLIAEYEDTGHGDAILANVACASIAYIRNNPVKAGLCEKPEDWRFSSAGISWSADFSPPESPSNVHAD